MMNKSVIITGASTGIGEELAKSYAQMGWNVGLIARRLDKIEALKRCEIPIYEPGLEDLIRRNVDAGRLSFTSETDSSISESLAQKTIIGLMIKIYNKPLSRKRLNEY